MSWLQRGAVWAWLCCYSIPLKLLLGVVVSGGRVRTISPEVCHSFLHLGWVAGISLADPILLLLPLATFPFLQDVTPGCGSEEQWTRLWGCGSEEVSEPCRTEPSGVVQSSSGTEPEPSLVQWSSSAAQHRWSRFQGFVWHCFPFPVIIFHCLGLGDGKSQLRGVSTILSFSQQPHGTKPKWQIPFVWIKHLPLFFYAFVTNIAAVTVHFLLHCCLPSVSGYLKPYSLPLSLSYWRGQGDGK